jgi:hypothetical protein
LQLGVGRRGHPPPHFCNLRRTPRIAAFEQQQAQRDAEKVALAAALGGADKLEAFLNGILRAPELHGAPEAISMDCDVDQILAKDTKVFQGPQWNFSVDIAQERFVQLPLTLPSTYMLDTNLIDPAANTVKRRFDLAWARLSE